LPKAPPTVAINLPIMFVVGQIALIALMIFATNGGE
jgi:hypothetical protein